MVWTGHGIGCAWTGLGFVCPEHELGSALFEMGFGWTLHGLDLECAQLSTGCSWLGLGPGLGCLWVHLWVI